MHGFLVELRWAVPNSWQPLLAAWAFILLMLLMVEVDGLAAPLTIWQAVWLSVKISAVGVYGVVIGFSAWACWRDIPL